MSALPLPRSRRHIPDDHDVVPKTPPPVFTGLLASFAGGIVEGNRAGAILGTDMTDPAVLNALVLRFKAGRPMAWQAACSFWSQFYFRTLLPPAIMLMVAGKNPSLDLAALRIVVCPDKGVPLAFCRMARDDLPACGGFDAECFERLLSAHLAPLIKTLAEVSGLSRRLCWENAAWPLTWALQEIATQHPASCGAIRAMIEPDGPHGAAALLAPTRRAVLDGQPFKRQFCCLRHLVPGVARCEGFCPRAS